MSKHRGSVLKFISWSYDASIPLHCRKSWKTWFFENHTVVQDIQYDQKKHHFGGTPWWEKSKNLTRGNLSSFDVQASFYCAFSCSNRFRSPFECILYQKSLRDTWFWHIWRLFKAVWGLVVNLVWRASYVLYSPRVVKNGQKTRLGSPETYWTCF